MSSMSESHSAQVTELRDQIRRLYLERGEPSLRDVARRTHGAVSHTTVGAVLRCDRLPRWGQVEMVVEALDGDVEAFRRIWVGTRTSAETPRATAPEEAPRQAPGEAPRGQALDGLPPTTTTFVGRAEELAILERERFVVISGLAGVGKSELALHHAYRCRADFPGGMLFADLHDYDPQRRRTPEQVLETFLRALGAVDIPPYVDERSALFRSLVAARPPMLIVIDNVATAASVRPLLVAGVRQVVTSRHMLVGLDDAYHLDLGVLSADEAAALVADAELAELCGRLPLALRIVRALRAGHPDHDWTAELRKARLETLDDGDDRSVSAAFDLSYRALTPEQQRFLRMIGLHPPPRIMPEGAAALATVSEDRARRLLRELRTAHLIEPGDRFHDLVQYYVLTTKTRDDSEKAAAMARLFAGLSKRAAGRARDLGTARRDEALSWFDDNIETLVYAAVAANISYHAHLAIPLTLALLDYRAIRGPESDFETAAELARDTGVNAKDWRAETHARIVAAYHCLDAGRDERAAAWFHSAWDTVRRRGDDALIEWTLTGFVEALRRTGRHEAAEGAALDLRLIRRRLGRQ
jgi:hypothetical protein